MYETPARSRYFSIPVGMSAGSADILGACGGHLYGGVQFEQEHSWIKTQFCERMCNTMFLCLCVCVCRCQCHVCQPTKGSNRPGNMHCQLRGTHMHAHDPYKLSASWPGLRRLRTKESACASSGFCACASDTHVCAFVTLRCSHVTPQPCT